jgi:hypothetical protein
LLAGLIVSDRRETIGGKNVAIARNTCVFGIRKQDSRECQA